MIRIAIVDDHPIVRAGMAAVLASATDMTLVGQTGAGADVPTLVRDCQPDVLILDVNLPDLNAQAVIAQLPVNNRPAILILTLHSDEKTIFSLLNNGVQGYLLKDEAVESLAQAVRAVAQGKSWLSPEIAHKVVRHALNAQQPVPTAPPAEDPPLTPREQEILGLLAQGLDNAAIAQRLIVTKRTIQNHVSTIYNKLGVTNRTEATLYALRHGWATLSEDGR